MTLDLCDARGRIYTLTSHNILELYLTKYSLAASQPILSVVLFYIGLYNQTCMLLGPSVGLFLARELFCISQPIVFVLLPWQYAPKQFTSVWSNL